MIDKSTIIRKPKIIIIIFGIISFIKIRIIGTFSPFELLAILFFLYQKVSNSNLKIEIFENKIYKSFTNLLILWSFCQLFSDIVNKTIISSSLKGVLAPLLIILSLRLLLILNKIFNYKYFIEDFIIGMGLCQIYYTFLGPSNIQTSIKYGLLFNICLVLFSLLKNQKINLILNLLFILIYINYGVRSFLIIQTIFFLSRLFGKENLVNTINYKLFFNIRNGIFKYFTIILLLLLLTPISRNINNFFVKIRPDDQRVNIIKSQSEGNFFSARLEYYSFFDSFKDAPILGHGSWPYDLNYKYYVIMFIVMTFVGIFFNPMNILAYNVNDLYLSLTLFYGGLLMASNMLWAHEIVHYFSMNMFNIQVFILGIILSTIISIFLLRNQLFVDDNQWLKRMISHHSTALTTSYNINNKTKNNRIKLLSQEIIDTQKREIQLMKKLIL